MVIPLTLKLLEISTSKLSPLETCSASIENFAFKESAFEKFSSFSAESDSSSLSFSKVSSVTVIRAFLISSSLLSAPPWNARGANTSFVVNVGSSKFVLSATSGAITLTEFSLSTSSALTFPPAMAKVRMVNPKNTEQAP